MIFGTPLTVHDWSDHAEADDGLRRLIAQARRDYASAGKSNVGGWHSRADFIGGDAPALDWLRQRIRAATTDLTRRFMAPGNYAFSIDGWANVLGAGDYNGPHNHPNASWSGVYYLTGLSGQAGLGGKIEFLDPRPAAGMGYAGENLLQRRCLFTPRPGCMILFPSWLQHMVHPHRMEQERLAIAFNVTVARESGATRQSGAEGG